MNHFLIHSKPLLQVFQLAHLILAELVLSALKDSTVLDLASTATN